jgi:hypothetical protein
MVSTAVIHVAVKLVTRVLRARCVMLAILHQTKLAFVLRVEMKFVKSQHVILMEPVMIVQVVLSALVVLVILVIVVNRVQMAFMIRIQYVQEVLIVSSVHLHEALVILGLVNAYARAILMDQLVNNVVTDFLDPIAQIAILGVIL